jgi:hypothetical protein
MAFGSIPFRPISLADQASGRCFSRGGVIVRGTPAHLTETPSAARSLTQPSTFNTAVPTTPRYVPPHRRTHPLSDSPTR